MSLLKLGSSNVNSCTEDNAQDFFLGLGGGDRAFKRCVM
jgi:hypothetical protein